MKSIRKEENEREGGEERDSHLPMPRRQGAMLLQTPRETVKVAVERGARAYFGVCRRLAKVLNRPRD
jgi:hypothetical protein